MQGYPYGQYVYPNSAQMPGAQMPVRYMVPSGYRQPSPPFANQSFNRYATVPSNPTPPQNMTQQVRYPPGYAQPDMQMPHASLQQQTPQQLQPPQPYYYNPYGTNQEAPSVTPAPKTPASKAGAKEYKEKAFTIAPDGTQSETIKGLVSNSNINDLLKHKGTKVKVSKIYRITKTKPDLKADSSSDDDLPLLKPPSRTQQPQPVPQPQETQRPSSSSSSCSHCSTCSNCSCTECRDRSRSHVYDDCPECRAEWNREQTRHRRRK
ncbi:unnamed protein product [Rotaria socialis]|uniref:Uncharacterized protein n=3 Tax=Rotaria socialis TaxID=392032 RepID=A0A820E092_9BILA|nr:unnamed protein product [Rotaria socialis]CAF3413016.1 unnamed protein product [Rotaria socialis]CAF3490586.1 unnamed protein product [Rotaria socialis]CAF3528707.1 unnamed protein product [Rotaria socialis]CAF4224423.1 unnamed protein product [Rotaria socialis]